jgi:hypothetical protein
MYVTELRMQLHVELGLKGLYTKLAALSRIQHRFRKQAGQKYVGRQ